MFGIPSTNQDSWAGDSTTAVLPQLEATAKPDPARSVPTRDDIEDYLPLVDTIVRRLGRRLPDHVELEDLRSVGIIGLIQAIERYEVSEGHTFEAYAGLRIRGAILDELRRMDHLPRTARAKARKIRAAVESLEQRHGRVPTDEEIQTELGLNLKEFRKMRRQAENVHLVSIDAPVNEGGDNPTALVDLLPDASDVSCVDRMEHDEMLQIMADRIENLPERLRKILALYYHEGLRLSEIAEIYGITEARVCQIHGQTVKALRAYLEAVRDR